MRSPGSAALKLAGAIALAALSAPAQAAPQLYGDLDADRRIGVSDAARVLMHVTGRDPLSQALLAVADADRDGNVGGSDVERQARAILGLEPPALYEPPAGDLLPLLRTDADGTIPLIDVPGVQLRLDPRLSDPITALGACAQLIVDCARGGASLDECVARAGACATGEPWTEAPCCPAACRDAYAAARAAGVEPIRALDQVLFVDGSCMPGLAAFLGGGR